MLGHRLQRWPKIIPTYIQRLLFATMSTHVSSWEMFHFYWAVVC